MSDPMPERLARGEHEAGVRAVLAALLAAAAAALVLAGVALMHVPSALILAGVALLAAARRIGGFAAAASTGAGYQPARQDGRPKSPPKAP